MFYGKLDFPSLNKLYEQVRAIVCPSIVPEPLPYTISETILKSRLIIASNSGGSLELGKGCKGAFFFESGNIKELAEKIEYVSALKKDTVNDLTAQSREFFLSNFNDDRVLHDFVSLCQDLISAN